MYSTEVIVDGALYHVGVAYGRKQWKRDKKDAKLTFGKHGKVRGRRMG